MSRAEKRERAEMTIKDMGLQDAIDTSIGGWSVKGISGGQKRRVSICIEILFLDEAITSGLDSAASYHVISRIIKLAQEDKRTVIASIHQPSGEVFDLFNNLFYYHPEDRFILVLLHELQSFLHQMALLVHP